MFSVPTKPGENRGKCLGEFESEQIRRNWMIEDRLMLNDDKTELMLIGTRQQLKKVINLNSITVGNTTYYRLRQNQ